KALLIERPYIGQQLHIYAAILFVALAGAWLAIKTISITKKTVNRFVFAGAGALTAILSTGLAASIFSASGPSPWKKYTPETLSASLDSDKVVIVDFTADWCINCKVLEETVLNAEPVRSRIRNEEEVIMIKADLTSTSAPGWEYLADLGRTGIPTLVIYGPGGEDPWIANAYTSDQVIAALDEAALEAPETPTELSSH
ncbi:MAG: thioredoxin family protein, partial [Planctomycetota bacterium]